MRRSKVRSELRARAARTERHASAGPQIPGEPRTTTQTHKLPSENNILDLLSQDCIHDDRFFAQHRVKPAECTRLMRLMQLVLANRQLLLSADARRSRRQRVGAHLGIPWPVQSGGLSVAMWSNADAGGIQHEACACW